MINYDGVDEAELIHALYHGTRPLGMGMLQNVAGLTLDQVRAELDQAYPRKDFGIPVMDLPNRQSDGSMYFDYYHGRPLKLTLNLKEKTFEERLYDRDAGTGRALKIVEDLLRTKGIAK